MRYAPQVVWLVTAFVAGSSVACKQDASPRAKTAGAASAYPSIAYELQVVQNQGWRDLADSSRALSDTDRKASGAVLGAPVAAVMDDEGRTYVLDALFQKLVVFGPEGTFERVIRSGYGKGPGEFSQPRALAIHGDKLFVLDEGNARVTIYKTDGTVVSSFPITISAPSRMAVNKNRIYLTTMRLGNNYPSVIAYDMQGGIVDSLVRVQGQDADLTANGAGGALGRRPDGTVLFAMPAPTVWREIDGDTQVHGQNNFPSAAGYMRKLPGGTEVRAVPVRVRGIAGLQDGSTAIYYLARENGAVVEGEVTDKGYIDVYDPKGVYTGSAALSGTEDYITMNTSPDGATLLFTTMAAEYPMVVRAKIVPLAAKAKATR